LFDYLESKDKAMEDANAITTSFNHNNSLMMKAKLDYLQQYYSSVVCLALLLVNTHPALMFIILDDLV
jgi:hypothetical protein